MRCPIRTDHKLVEIAEGLFQCPHCGYGPSLNGHRPYWAISSVEESDDGVIDAISVRFDPQLDCYVMTGVAWVVDEHGVRIPGSFIEGVAAFISTAEEKDRCPLPVVIRAKGKWDYPPAKPTLKPQMFPDPLGSKEISLQSGRRGTS